MRTKKINAVLGLLAICILLAHSLYQVAAYILFIYNPLVTRILGWATAAVVYNFMIVSFIQKLLF